MSSKYTPRLRQLLLSNVENEIWQVSLEEFCALLNAPKSYKISNIDVEILTPSLQILRQEFEGISCEKIKQGRGSRVVGLRFCLSQKGLFETNLSNSNLTNSPLPKAPAKPAAKAKTTPKNPPSQKPKPQALPPILPQNEEKTQIKAEPRQSRAKPKPPKFKEVLAALNALQEVKEKGVKFNQPTLLKCKECEGEFSGVLQAAWQAVCKNLQASTHSVSLKNAKLTLSATKQKKPVLQRNGEGEFELSLECKKGKNSLKTNKKKVKRFTKELHNFLLSLSEGGEC